MTSRNPVTLCRYHYDALDQVAISELANHDRVQRFYQKNRLTTQIQGHIQHTLLHANDHLLALQSAHDRGLNCALLATTRQDSVIGTPQSAFSYTPYGHRHPQANSMSLPGFNGQQADRVTGHYLLGNGYRAFNPVLMRFNSPDRLSPFGDGGLNAYAYCKGDPVNQIDPTGHIPAFMKPLSKFLSYMSTPSEAKDAFVSLKLSNKRTVFEEITVYDHTLESGQKQLVVNAHGARPGIASNSTLFAQQEHRGAEHLIAELKEQGTVFENYESAHIIACFSADTSMPFAEQFSRQTGLPTLGYKGVVSTQEKLKGNAMTIKILRKNLYELSSSKEHKARGKSFSYAPYWFGRSNSSTSV
ncbi:RHS repeat-associated core domain-containing protein [Pseudomonas alliivorans]|nr:RHS repeat-associated core domain-containing protein [Pseudomonas alliivorans]MEE4342624.1 RHS repeat-associated core domain-containing protein [Pseudomonas alliivorans]MEE4375284.1 RHS repeat-associated core domain-containing protein [Pseudomonas alliivorans]MEE4635667.1 RHS repeat-associated core domain-containing protein [Pseudomonas alliivorans]MEE4650731.1 RHS repeat-associated core domain-containing protein [Pseudomonas alliivorans]